MPRPTTKAKAEVYYPESDGKPMGETGIHVNASIEIFTTLKYYFYPNRSDIYLTADMFFYYEQGNPRAVKAPDVMVIQGMENRVERRTYKLWVEKRVPSVIFEITSAETRRDDTVTKRALYARLGIPEYFLFDPLAEYLDPQLQGYRLAGQEYVPIVPEPDGIFESLELGLKIQADDNSIRFYEAAMNRPIPNLIERDEQADTAQILIKDLRDREKQLDRERKKATREARRAEIQSQKAEAERQKAEALEAEVARLRALLGERGIEG